VACDSNEKNEKKIITQSTRHVSKFCWQVLVRDQKWKNLKW